MTRTGPFHTLRRAALLLAASAIEAAALAAQWRVTSVPPTAGRPVEVRVESRERADSIEHLDGPIALVIRCVARQLDAFVTTRDTLESDMAADVRVRIRSDSMRARDVRWQATRSSTGAFIPSRELRDLIQRHILRSSTISATIATAQRGRVTYVFPVTDFRPALEALREACPNDRGSALAQPVH